jgi:RHS repeat-associated protein
MVSHYNGNVFQIVNNRYPTTRNDSFAYDSLNRISSAQSNGSQWGETFTIDAWGNLTNRAGISGKTYYEPLACPANTNNQLTTCSQVYDAAGNMTSNGTASYVYDAENRLIATAGYSYIYDANGQRVEKCTEGSTPGTCASGATGTLYWRGLSSDPLSETNLAGTVQNNYVFFNGQRVARSDSTPLIHYYFSDHLGSHGVVENATGTTCEQDIDYYPYGGVEEDYCPNVVQNYKFTGKERDSESGLDYFEARHYASTLGRFMSVDPVIITPERKVDPQQLNRYAYVRNNPLRLVDPTGEILELSGDLAADTAALCSIVGSGNCDRISINEQNNTVSFNTSGLDLSANEGAALVNQLVTSSDTYGFALSDTANTAGGPVKLTNDPISNLDNQSDVRYSKSQTDLPSKGVADQVTIDPKTAHFTDSQGRSVSLSSLAFHELAEAYAKIDGGKQYVDFQNLNVVNGTTVQIGSPQQGAHNEAVQREFKLREQRPNLQNSGRAGDQLIRDPHN